MARSRVQTIRSAVPGARPSGREPGELFTNWPDKQLGVVDPGKQPVDLIAIRFFSSAAVYAPGDMVVNAGRMYRTETGSPAGAFDPAKWNEISTGNAFVSDTAPSGAAPGALWFETDTGDLFIWYADVNSSQWVQV